MHMSLTLSFTHTYSFALSPTRSFAHTQEARMVSIGLDAGASCGFGFHVTVIFNFFLVT